MREWQEASAEELRSWDDAVARHACCRVVHQRAWLESLERSGYGRPLYLTFRSDGEAVAWLPGLLVDVGPFRLYGSSLPGWQTVSMGPVFDATQVGTDELITTLVPFLERHHAVDHMEILSPDLDTPTMSSLGFRGEPVPTYRARLFPGDEPCMMRALKDSARRNIKRGLKLRLQVQFESDDAFVNEHYDQLAETYARGGYRINFRRQRVLECFRQMKAAGHLLAVSVYLPDESVSIASGIFTTFNRELLLWSWAHRTRHRWYNPTELLTWSVMTKAMAAGCDSFDLMGRGDFKAKFGAELDETKVRWVRSRHRWLTAARDAAQWGGRWRMAVLGRLARAVPARRWTRASDRALALRTVQ